MFQQLLMRIIKTKRMRLAEHTEYVGEMVNVCSISIGKTEGKRPLGDLTTGRKDNSRMIIKGRWCEIVYWIHLALNRDQWHQLL
jgi:hypothetical protein